MKQYTKNIIVEFITIFIITFLFNMFCHILTHDEVWNYGFAYNISNGLIPYHDFNMIITPLFPIIGAIFLSLFGKSMIVYHLFNALICTAIFFFIKKNNNKSYYITYAIFLFFSSPGYNVACLLLLYLLMTMEDNKKNDYLIGFILGISFLTKQNIGIFMCIPTLFINDKNKIIKRIIGFIIPNIILLFYLLNHHILYNFIDYVFLGINSFAKENTTVYLLPLFIWLLGLGYIILYFIKTKCRSILYLICFLGLAYPLFDPIHVMLCIIPIINIFLNNLNLNKRIISITFVTFIIAIFTYNIIIYQGDNYDYPNNTYAFRYRKINNDVATSINIVTKYLNSITNKVFIIDPYAYLIKLNAGIKIDKYDLLNNGNLGKNGEKRIIKEITDYCNYNDCIFLVYESAIGNKKYSQYNDEISKYIIDKYNKKENILNLSIYSNN